MNEMYKRNTSQMWFVPVILISFMIAVSVTSAAISTIRPATDKFTGIWGQTHLKKFSSYEELENFVNAAYYTDNFYSGVRMADGLISVPLAMFWGANSEYYNDYVKYIINPGSDIPIDYSTTNIQVDGVDEADIVKSDGKYIYVVSGNQVFIIDAYPAENARILSRIEVDGNPTEIFVNENKLVVLGWGFIKVYDISDRENPTLKRDVTFNGYYFNSRMIGNYVYVIVNDHIYCYDEDVELPYISSNGNVKVVPATEICYFENFHDYSYDFTTIMAINTQNDDENITSETFLLGATRNIFVSLGNIYITQTMVMYTEKFVKDPWGGHWDCDTNEKTIIHKISISGGRIEYRSQGEVSGCVLNQFSMDEYRGYFRIATTTGDVWDGSARNHVYILNEDLSIVGRLEGLASGEKIYSARFMGNRAYLVTFKNIDPLFVIDLTDPTNPRTLGELEIPGYSDYLHPYDETHVIGIGKDAYDMGSFAWYQGVKIALFDVSDPENPMEISSYVIGDRGTDSYALSDHRAFLFSRSKNLLVIPISLAEINEEQYPGEVPPNAYGEHTWDGAYVFNISTEGGLALKGRITHSEENTQPCWGWYDSPNSVKRSLYIDNVLYTISDRMVKMNNLNDLSEEGEINLSVDG